MKIWDRKKKGLEVMEGGGKRLGKEERDWDRRKKIGIGEERLGKERKKT